MDVTLRKDVGQSAWEQIVGKIMCDLPSEDEYAGFMVVKTYDLCVPIDTYVPRISPGIFFDIHDRLRERLPLGSDVHLTGGTIGPVYLDAKVKVNRAPGKDRLPPYSKSPEKKGTMHILLVAKTLHLAMGSSFSHAHALVLGFFCVL